MNVARYHELLDVLRAHDKEKYVGHGAPDVDTDSLRLRLAEYFGDGREERRAVLGIDIFKYSKYAPEQQRLIPVLFQYIHDSVLADCNSFEAYLFHESATIGHFISTGDGGFQIMPTPLHALVFAIYTQINVQYFNASFRFPGLRKLIGPITLRYTLSFDSVFQLDHNFFGPAIITNARILSRDRLNRLLIDANTIDWFVNRIGSLENLLAFTNDELGKITELSNSPIQQLSSTLLFSFGHSDGPPASAFKTVIVQKIGAIAAKETNLDIYSAYLQVEITRVRPQFGYRKVLITSIGNLNSAGISE